MTTATPTGPEQALAQVADLLFPTTQGEIPYANLRDLVVGQRNLLEGNNPSGLSFVQVGEWVKNNAPTVVSLAAKVTDVDQKLSEVQNGLSGLQTTLADKLDPVLAQSERQMKYLYEQSADLQNQTTLLLQRSDDQHQEVIRHAKTKFSDLPGKFIYFVP